MQPVLQSEVSRVATVLQQTLGTPNGHELRDELRPQIIRLLKSDIVSHNGFHTTL